MKERVIHTILEHIPCALSLVIRSSYFCSAGCTCIASPAYEKEDAVSFQVQMYTCAVESHQAHGVGAVSKPQAY